jgi:hypothetical protein
VAVLTDRTGRFFLTAPRGEHTLSGQAAGFGLHRELVNIGRQTNELSLSLTALPQTPRDSSAH